MLKRIS